jgi:hypothetical protein
MRNDINGINKFIASICGLGRPFYEKKIGEELRSV